MGVHWFFIGVSDGWGIVFYCFICVYCCVFTVGPRVGGGIHHRAITCLACVILPELPLLASLNLPELPTCSQRR